MGPLILFETSLLFLKRIAAPHRPSFTGGAMFRFFSTQISLFLFLGLSVSAGAADPTPAVLTAKDNCTDIALLAKTTDGGIVFKALCTPGGKVTWSSSQVYKVIKVSASNQKIFEVVEGSAGPFDPRYVTHLNTDASNNIIVTGDISRVSIYDNLGFHVTKLSANGSMLWQKKFMPPTDASVYVFEHRYSAAAVTSDGANTFLAMRESGMVPKDQGTYGAGPLKENILKLDSQGNIQWNKEGALFPYDPAKNIYADATPLSLVEKDGLIYSFSGGLAQIRAQASGDVLFSSQSAQNRGRLLRGGNNKIYEVELEKSTGMLAFPAVARLRELDAQLSQVRTIDFNPAANDGILSKRDVAIDSAGDIFVTGRKCSSVDTNCGIYTAKYRASQDSSQAVATPVWESVYAATTLDNGGLGFEVIVDASGVYVGGRFAYGSRFVRGVLKYQK